MTNTLPRAATTATTKRTAEMASNQQLNVNDLLNFTLPPRQTHLSHNLPRRSRKNATHLGVWNKERFINAQYRFVMNPAGDYTVHFADPDIFFQWQDILQVIVPRASVLASAASSGGHIGRDEGHTTCPICLSPPVAPRMTKCGHVFCLPCILHYLSTADNKWARCPICFDSVNEKQLKSVKWFDGPVQHPQDFQVGSSSAPSYSSFTPQEGTVMRMRLMQRPKITTLALPRSQTWPSDLISPHQASFHFLPDVYTFAKFMLATPAYLISDLSQDLAQLDVERRTLSGMKDDLGVSFVDAADLRVRLQIERATTLETPLLKEAIDKAMRDQAEIEQRSARIQQRRGQEEVSIPEHSQISEVPEAMLAAKAGGQVPLTLSHPVPSIAASLTPTPNRNVSRQRRNLNPPPPSTSTYYFYQAASGLPIYFHPLDSKILLNHFSGYASFPDSITIRVESFTEGAVNDDLRKRCKYLSHMPESADVVFIEADLSGVVGSEGLRSFEVALKTRRTRRLEKSRKDDRARARAEEREREKQRAATSWAQSNWHSVPQPTPEVMPEAVGVEPPPPPPSIVTPVRPGAWGDRSFASALYSNPTPSREPPQQRDSRNDLEDEWDIDLAWHELEQRSGTAGRRKRSNKLVVLGGAGGRRR